MNSSVVLIPSRLNSRRLPSKPLIDINGLPLIIRVAKQVSLSKKVKDFYVCTDSKEIFDVVESYNYKAILTSNNHINGTTRIAEAYEKLNKNYDYIVDVQGDEPFINPSHIDKVIEYHKNCNADIILPHLEFDVKKDSESIVKLIDNKYNEVMYLSRSQIPYNFFDTSNFYLKKHLSIISFTPVSLQKYCNFDQTSQEKLEGIELLRALENKLLIKTFKLEGDSFSIDTFEDLEKAKLYADKADI